MNSRNESARMRVLQNPLLRKNHVHRTTHKQGRKAVRRQLAKRQWDDRSAEALR